jgi:hypothetical protein
VLLTRGLGRARDVLRAVRRELMALEEVLPWEAVSPAWRQRRNAWRKHLKALDISKVASWMID